MQWFGTFSVTWWPGAIGWLLFGGLLIVRWIRHTRTAKPAGSFAELFAHFKTFFSTEAAQGVLSNRRLGLLTLMLGLTSMVSVLVGDSIKNQPCQQACQDEGWNSGRHRTSNPHAPTETPGCWCFSGDEWSETPIDP